MSHEIQAFRPEWENEDKRNELFDICCPDIQHENYLDNYAEYSRTVHVARITRSAGNPLNGLIYNLLGCPEYSAGVSGTGEEQRFSFAQIEAALALYSRYVERSTPATMYREENLYDSISEIFGLEVEAGTRVAEVTAITTVQEYRFLLACRDHLKTAASQERPDQPKLFGDPIFGIVDPDSSAGAKSGILIRFE